MTATTKTTYTTRENTLMLEDSIKTSKLILSIAKESTSIDEIKSFLVDLVTEYERCLGYKKDQLSFHGRGY